MCENKFYDFVLLKISCMMSEECLIYKLEHEQCRHSGWGEIMASASASKPDAVQMSPLKTCTYSYGVLVESIMKLV